MNEASNFNCDCEEWMRPACAGNAIYERHEGKCYCVLHFPRKKNQSTFQDAVWEKLLSKDYNFSGVWFDDDVNFENFHFESDAVFAECTFEGKVFFYKNRFDGKADFLNAHFKSVMTFSGVTVKSAADFSGCIFEGLVDFTASEFPKGASFEESTFNKPVIFATEFGDDANFSGVEFCEWVEFNDSEFKGANFIGTTFNQLADFIDTTFDGNVCFNFAVFADSARFGKPNGGREVFGDKADLSLEDARIDNPQRFSFHSLRLKPSWFFNVDSRKFEFINVSWFKIGIDENYEPFRQAHILLRITYRHLAVNAEENHRYREASDFRYLAMDVHRYERTKPGQVQWHKFAFWELTWWYWLASGYGERVVRAFIGLLGMWLLFSLIFTQVGFVVTEKALPDESKQAASNYEAAGRPLSFPRALTHTAAVMTLQKPEPKPHTNTAQAAVLFATILGPLQAALLALAIRRKFIR